ncbi:hypothetical protein [Nocardia sp. NPDC003979]
MDARSTFEAARPLMWAAYSTDARIGVSLWAPITPEVWQDWVESRVSLRTDAYSIDDGHPPDTATASSRVFSVSPTPADRAPIVFSVFARSTRAGAERAWLVTEMRVL